jgi:hypothetical protein
VLEVDCRLLLWSAAFERGIRNAQKRVDEHLAMCIKPYIQPKAVPYDRRYLSKIFPYIGMNIRGYGEGKNMLQDGCVPVASAYRK